MVKGYIISVIAAITFFSFNSLAQADHFKNGDDSDGCISSETLLQRVQMVKERLPGTFGTGILATHEGPGKDLLAGINTVYFDEKKDQIKFDYLVFLSGPDGAGGTAGMVVVSDNPDQWCEYIKLDANETGKLDLVLKSLGA